MGGVGLPIYRLKDKFSSAFLVLRVIPNERLAATIGHLYLDFITSYNCELLLIVYIQYLRFPLAQHFLYNSRLMTEQKSEKW